MKKSIQIISILACIILFTSCASVFETRNYSHLHYVKQKGNKMEESSVTNDQSTEESPQNLSFLNEKLVLPEQSYLPLRTLKKNQAARNTSTAQQKNAESRGNISSHSEPFKLPELPILKKQQKKLESATDQLFSGLDSDLRIALIFGIAGIIAVLVGALLYGAPPLGEIFYVIGVILIIIGLAYLIKYLVENG